MTFRARSHIEKRINILITLVVICIVLELAFVLVLRSSSDPEKVHAEEAETSIEAVSREISDPGMVVNDAAEVVVDQPNQIQYPSLALIIDDMGNQWNTEIIQGLLSLEIPMTVAVLPERWASRKIVERASELNLDAIIHFPMEPVAGNQSYMEKSFLKSGMTLAEINELCEAFDGMVPGCIGVNNHQGSAATQNSELVRSFARVAKSKGWFIIDSLTHPKSRLFKEAISEGVPAIRRDYFLDHYQVEDSIRATLYRAVELSEKRGRTSVIIGHPVKATWEVLRNEVSTLAESGVEWVTISQVLTNTIQ